MTLTSLRLAAFVALAVPLGACRAPRPPLEDPTRAEVKSTSRSLASYSSWDRLTEGKIGEDRYATPLPDGAGLVFASNRHSNFFKLYLREFGGNRVRRLTSGTGHDTFPALSPAGDRIAFTSTRDGVAQLYLQSGFEDRQPRRLGDPGVEARHPAWSPDGNQLAYCRLSPTTSRWEIWIHDLTASSDIHLTDGLFPTFSPDGRSLAFQRHRRRDDQWFSIWTVRTDGTREQEVVAGEAWGATNPAWSPNGQWIAFNSVGRSSSDGDTGTDLYAIRVDGTNSRQLTFKPGPEWNPNWGLDGRIYFTATVDGETALWSIAAPRPQRTLSGM